MVEYRQGLMGSREERRKTFDEVAELYDRHRPGYPEQLVDDVAWLSGIPPRGRILEIGCGTGKATAQFARRGYAMTCLEPGVRLAEIARRNLATFPDVRIETCAFEEWQPVRSDAALVIAAQSFHFIDPEAGLPKVARCLGAGGAVAIFGNHPQNGASEVHARVQHAYSRHAPELSAVREESPLEERMDATHLFETVVMTRYPWQITYSATDYVGLMATQSDHRLLPPSRLAELLDAIRDAIESLGGAITIDYVTRLHLARRRNA